MTSSKLLALGFAASLLPSLPASCAGAADANWPNWRGPRYNGSAEASGLHFPQNPSEARWVAELPGRAGSTPVVWGDRVFLTSPDASKNLNLLAFDRRSGAALWSRTVSVGDKTQGRNNTAAPSPSTDGRRVYAMFGNGELAAFDFDGAELWHRRLCKDYGRFAFMWIYGSSPLLYGGKLYVQVLQRDDMPADYPLNDGTSRHDSFLLALDPATGETLWKTDRPTDASKESHESYATPAPCEAPGGPQLLVVGGDYLSGHRADTGEELWRARLYEKRDDWYRIVTSPVAWRDLALGCGPKGQPVVAVKTDGRGDVTAAKKAWEFRDSPTDWATPLVYGDKLFVLNGDRHVLTRVNPATGAVVWTGRVPVNEPIWSSPTGADGKVFLYTEAGALLAYDAGDEFKLAGRVSLDEPDSRGTVVVAQGDILVRGSHHLYCFGPK